MVQNVLEFCSGFEHQYLDYRLNKNQQSADSNSSRTPLGTIFSFDAGKTLLHSVVRVFNLEGYLLWYGRVLKGLIVCKDRMNTKLMSQ